MEPCPEITQFPSVLVELRGSSSRIVAEFDSFVRPLFNPTLSRFATELTGITQREVDSAPIISDVLKLYLDWLKRNALVDDDNRRIGNWSVVTWTDADIGVQLSTELRQKRIVIPPCLNDWIDLKELYRRHFKRAPIGGLRACVEGLGLAFEGRAHNGLVDSQNTAKIVLLMARGNPEFGSFTFRRSTVKMI
jgi:inhibitor of KinA sporulation pathway (predicted exonuclease)